MEVAPSQQWDQAHTQYFLFNFFYFGASIWFNLMKDFHWFSWKKLISKSIISISMLIIELWECLELHIIGWAAPEEFLLWEFKPFIVAHTHRDIVVRLDTTNSAPKEQLVEVGSVAVV